MVSEDVHYKEKKIERRDTHAVGEKKKERKMAEDNSIQLTRDRETGGWSWGKSGE